MLQISSINENFNGYFGDKNRTYGIGHNVGIGIGSHNVTYGTTPAAFLAKRSLHEAALQNVNKFPEAATHGFRLPKQAHLR